MSEIVNVVRHFDVLFHMLKLVRHIKGLRFFICAANATQQFKNGQCFDNCTGGIECLVPLSRMG